MNTEKRALRANFHHSQGLQKDEAGQEVQKRLCLRTAACNLRNYRHSLTHATLRAGAFCPMPLTCQEIPAEG